MLTGTLITCCGFIPVAFSQGMASEFCGALFPVIGIALLLSWIVSVMVAPLYGTYLIKVNVGPTRTRTASTSSSAAYSDGSSRTSASCSSARPCCSPFLFFP